MNEPIVIVGAGQAAAQAVETLRKRGHQGPLTVVGDEDLLPYQRPPLSKKFLAGAMEQDRLLLRHAAHYRDHAVDLRLGFAAVSIDPAAHRVPTPSGKIELFSERIASFGYADCPGHPAWFEPTEWLGAANPRYPLHLISSQPATKLHSQYDHGIVSRERKIRGREPIRLHPEDAAARGLAAGDIVRVFNDRGQCLAGVRIEPGLKRGVVQMSTGAWYDPLVPGEIGTLDKHGNPNVLTLDKGTSLLAQGASAHTCLVEVERFEGELPPITAFDPPPFADEAARS